MRALNIGGQGFEDFIKNGDFYVDKTYFIKEWIENRSQVTLITRPRRFGKTLNMQMRFNRYADIFLMPHISWYSEETLLLRKVPLFHQWRQP